MMIVEEVMPRKRKKPPRTDALATSFNSLKTTTLALITSHAHILFSEKILRVRKTYITL